MANILTRNPMLLTGTMSTSYKAAVATSLGTLTTLRVAQLRWFNPTLVDDQVLLTDPQDGSELLRLRCITAGQDIVVDWSARPHLWADFQAVQFDSGRLYIYIV